MGNILVLKVYLITSLQFRIWFSNISSRTSSRYFRCDDVRSKVNLYTAVGHVYSNIHHNIDIYIYHVGRWGASPAGSDYQALLSWSKVMFLYSVFCLGLWCSVVKFAVRLQGAQDFWQHCLWWWAGIPAGHLLVASPPGHSDSDCLQQGCQMMILAPLSARVVFSTPFTLVVLRTV